MMTTANLLRIQTLHPPPAIVRLRSKVEQGYSVKIQSLQGYTEADMANFSIISTMKQDLGY